MILYLDTSALVKLYVQEAHSSRVRGWVQEAEIVATCRVAYPETLSAIRRRFTEGDLTRKEQDLLLGRFSKDWTHFAAVDFDEREAGRLVIKHGLRGLDALHLSAAIQLRSAQGSLALAFASFDAKLNSAAATEGFVVLAPGSGAPSP